VQPQHRRGWGSLYDALAVGEIYTTSLEPLLTRHPLAGGEPIYAVDVSVWPRCDAETSPGRALYYHSSRHSAGQPIVAGWAYSWIAQVGFAQDSWTAPLRVRRLRPQENANAVAAEQIAAFLPHLRADGPLPWFLFDAGDDPVQLTQALGDARAALLVRLRSGRCFSADPTAQPRSRALAGRAALATSSPAMRPRRGPSPRMTSPSRMSSMARCACGRGRGWHPKTHGLHAQREARRADDGRSCVGRFSSSRSVVCPNRRTSRKPSGSGGIRPKIPSPSQTWIARGTPTCAASIWNTPSASSNSRSMGPFHVCAIQNRRIAGRGWSCWLLLSCALPVRLPATSHSRGSAPKGPASSRPHGSGVRLRHFCSDSRSWHPRQNPAGALLGVPKASAPVAQSAIRPLPRPFSVLPNPPKLKGTAAFPRKRPLLSLVARLLLVKSQA
jgi:hypothetical protein